MALAESLQEKRGPRIGDSASLWNFTPAPGWSREETDRLRVCLRKFGVGQWMAILNTGLLPGKMIQQLNGATQRLIGQQSLAAYTGLRVDIDRIRRDNEERKEGVTRKSGLIINDGPSLSKDQKAQLRREMLSKYGLMPDQQAETEQQYAELMAFSGTGCLSVNQTPAPAPTAETPRSCFTKSASPTPEPDLPSPTSVAAAAAAGEAPFGVPFFFLDGQPMDEDAAAQAEAQQVGLDLLLDEPPEIFDRPTKLRILRGLRLRLKLVLARLRVSRIAREKALVLGLKAAEEDLLREARGRERRAAQDEEDQNNARSNGEGMGDEQDLASRANGNLNTRSVIIAGALVGRTMQRPEYVTSASTTAPRRGRITKTVAGRPPSLAARGTTLQRVDEVETDVVGTTTTSSSSYLPSPSSTSGGAAADLDNGDTDVLAVVVARTADAVGVSMKMEVDGPVAPPPQLRGRVRKPVAVVDDHDGSDASDFEVTISHRPSRQPAGRGVRARPPRATKAATYLDTSDLATLLDLGFSKAQARDALLECAGDVAAAVEWLFANTS